MSRRASAPRREILPDPRYHSELLAKFMNMIMEDGKKSKAEAIVYGALTQIGTKKGTDEPLEILEEALDNIRPAVEVKSRRVGGATYQVPVEVRPERRNSLAMRWIISGARNRSGRTMIEKLASELADASQGVGAAVKKREDTHRMAEANKAFAHYKW